MFPEYQMDHDHFQSPRAALFTSGIQTMDQNLRKDIAGSFALRYDERSKTFSFYDRGSFLNAPPVSLESGPCTGSCCTRNNLVRLQALQYWFLSLEKLCYYSRH